MAATNDMSVDSARGQQWCDAVDQITNRVENIMKGVTGVLEELGSSDEGGNIGQLLVKAAGAYLTKFTDMVKAFAEAVVKIAEFLGKVADFVDDLMSTFKSIGGMLGLSF